MQKSPITIGHINLAKSMNSTGEHFVRLVEALDRQGVRQHVLVANTALSRRVSVYEEVTVGPVVKSAMMAYCLMPDVAVAHIHESHGEQAGLVLMLTRSIPYVLTRRSIEPISRNPISRSSLRRSASVICPHDSAADTIRHSEIDVPIDVIPDLSHETSTTANNRAAAEHLRVYRRAADSLRIPALLI